MSFSLTDLRAEIIGEGSTGHLCFDASRLSFLPAGHPQGYPDAFNAFVADSYASLEHVLPEITEQSLPQLVNGLRAANLSDAVLESVRGDGAWVDTAFEHYPSSPLSLTR